MESQWNLGLIPEKYRKRLGHIYAHAFLFALDGFSKAFSSLSDTKGVSPGVREEYENFKSTFPDLTPVRDSAHHMENRIRLLGRRNRKITPEIPIHIFGTILVGENDELSYLIEDGRNASIEISLDTVVKVRDIFQNLVNYFEWEGSPRFEVF